MKINTKKLIQISLCMIVAGAVLTGIGILMGGWPGVALSRNGVFSPYAENGTYTIEKTKIDSFSNAELEISSYADIHIQPSDDKYFYLEYQLDREYGEPRYEVKKDTLSLTHKGRHKGGIYFFNIGFHDSSEIHAYITLYIPKNQDMGRLSVSNDCGNLSVKGLTFGNTKLTSSYGDVNLQNTAFEDLELVLDSGDLKADSLTAKKLLLYNEYGDVTLKNISAQNADLDLDSGNLKAASFECESLTAKNEYGDIDLDDLSAETVEIKLECGNAYVNATALANLTCKNEYGDVEVQLPESLEDYTINAHSDYGSIRLPLETPHGYLVSSSDEADYRAEGKSKGKVTIEVESGNIILNGAMAASSELREEKKQ